MKKGKKTLYWLVGIASLFILGLISWVVIETGIEVTSRPNFCGTCHAMKPMVNSYHDSIHGGNNPRGITAACTDCHVSHENVFKHFLGKARSGTHDAWVTLVRDESTLDWQEKRLSREEYVYDSGCLTCHQKLQAATADNGFHTNYFNGVITSKCASCHESVGHANLNKYLLETKYKYHFDE
ncbi:MAG TPA: cytochrome C [Chloroflexi bacterium]|nr:MAG: cytochrome C [Chloroflexota bacterium]HDD56244.1 cytochrome C [Chloroflexota bacterium]